MTDEERLYKTKYVLAFYEKDDDTLVFIANNCIEICKRLGWKVNKRNMNYIQVDIYRSLRRSNHQTNLFRGKCYKVYIIDMTEDYEEDMKEENENV